MNYLAHLFLADDSDPSLVGNLLGDFARGVDVDGLPDAVRAGVERHRRVDDFTDAHPVFKLSRSRLRAEFGHFSGILVDIVYDHFLARGWERWSCQALPGFSRRVHRALDASPHLSERLRRFLPRMVAEDLLVGYSRPDGILRALRGVAHRSRRAPDPGRGLAVLMAQRADLDGDFQAFFPELLAFVDAERAARGECEQAAWRHADGHAVRLARTA